MQVSWQTILYWSSSTHVSLDTTLLLPRWLTWQYSFGFTGLVRLFIAMWFHSSDIRDNNWRLRVTVCVINLLQSNVFQLIKKNLSMYISLWCTYPFKLSNTILLSVNHSDYIQFFLAHPHKKQHQNSNRLQVYVLVTLHYL